MAALYPQASLKRLLIAQPRLLSPDEIDEVDSWVRDGGRVLLFADPHLDWPADAVPAGARAPQPAAMVGTLLARWGLILRYDPAQAGSVRTLAVANGADASPCQLRANADVAECKVGWGRVTVVAGAATLAPGGNRTAREAEFRSLVDSALGG